MPLVTLAEVKGRSFDYVVVGELSYELWIISTKLPYQAAV
jgi:hypothetical protein